MNQKPALPWWPRLITVTVWALLDLRRDAAISIMSVLMLFLLLGPPLFLGVVQTTVVEGWAARLQSDPRNREVKIIGEVSGPEALTDVTIARLMDDPLVGFVVPEASTFIATGRFQGPSRPATLDILTSTTGDPILGGTPAPTATGEIALTEAAAQLLAVTTGQSVELTLRRQPRNRQAEALRVPLTVIGIVPASAWSGEIAFVHPDLAGGAALWQAPQSGRPDVFLGPGDQAWKSMRIYAAEVRSAPALAHRLEAMGFETRIASDQVSLLVTLSDGLQHLMRIAVTAGLAGLAVAVWLLQVLAVARRHREIALMGVAGLDRAGNMLFFVVQSLMLCAGALALAGVAIVPVQGFANGFARRFLLETSQVDALPPLLLAAAALLVLGLALLSALLAAWRIRSIDLTTHLRSD